MKMMNYIVGVVGLINLLLAAPALAQGSQCGQHDQEPCEKSNCAMGLQLGKDSKCHLNLSQAPGLKAKATAQGTTASNWSYPGYQIVCVSNTRLGDCGQWFTITDSIAGNMTDGSPALWTLYNTYNGTCPAGGSTQAPTNPLYKYVCVSKQRLGDCGQWFNVVSTTTGTIGSQKYLWILFSKYNGACP